MYVLMLLTSFNPLRPSLAGDTRHAWLKVIVPLFQSTPAIAGRRYYPAVQLVQSAVVSIHSGHRWPEIRGIDNQVSGLRGVSIHSGHRWPEIPTPII